MGGSNQISNGSFESGTSFWSYHSRNHGSFALVNSTIEGTKGGRVTVNSVGSNIQLYQNGISLKPNTGYRLSFYGYSNSGHDLDVFLHKHVAPYTNYGLILQRDFEKRGLRVENSPKGESRNEPSD